jgi:GT2 family glycosyltransferase
MSNKIPFNPLETPERPTMFVDLHDGTTEQVSIIVVHRDRPEFLNLCLQSIHIMSNLNNFEVIVVDNGSGQESQEYLDAAELEGVKVIRNKENLYWSKAANMGAAAADKRSKYLIFLHCDTVILNNAWIDLLINISEGRSSGMVGTQLQTYYISNQKCDFIQEWCLLMTRDCWKDCGPWPEELPLVGNAFIMTLRAQRKGYKPTAAQNALVHHYRAAAFDPNLFEQMATEAMSKVPKLMEAAQS